MANHLAKKSIVGVIALAWLSFACNPNAADSSRRAGQPTSVAATESPPPLQIVYGARIRPDRLSISQAEEIRGWILSAGVSEPIWFVYVRSNGEGNFYADVYYRPASELRHIAHGQFVTIGRSAMVDAVKRALGQPPTTQPAISKTSEYTYVRAKGDGTRPNGDPPTGNQMPFEVEGEFTDQELKEIADLYRGSKRTSVTPISANQFNRRLPIMTIRRVEGEIEIMTGIQEAMLSGSGQILQVRHTPNGIELVKSADWVS